MGILYHLPQVRNAVQGEILGQFEGRKMDQNAEKHNSKDKEPQSVFQFSNVQHQQTSEA